MSIFANLSESDRQVLTETPYYVGLLIAHSDGDADHKELEWIEKVTAFREKTSHHSMREYYGIVHHFVSANANLMQSDLPSDQNEKMQFLVDKIARANRPLSELTELQRERMIEGYRSLALSVAEISGGLLSFFSQNPEETKWLELDMLKS